MISSHTEHPEFLERAYGMSTDTAGSVGMCTPMFLDRIKMMDMMPKGRRDATPMFLDMINMMDMMSKGRRDVTSMFLDMINMMDMMPTDRRDATPIF